MNQAIDIAKVAAVRQQLQAGFEAEVRAVAKDIFVGLLVPYLNSNTTLSVDGINPDPKIIRHFANISYRCAPYLHEAAGMVRLKDEELWPKIEGEKQ